MFESMVCTVRISIEGHFCAFLGYFRRDLGLIQLSSLGGTRLYHIGVKAIFGRFKVGGGLEKSFYLYKNAIQIPVNVKRRYKYLVTYALSWKRHRSLRVAGKGSSTRARMILAAEGASSVCISLAP